MEVVANKWILKVDVNFNCNNKILKLMTSNFFKD